MGKTGWHDGFAITVDTVAATPTKIDIELSYENLVGVSHNPTDEAYLERNGTVVALTFDSPEIAGNAEASGTATAALKTKPGADLTKR